MKIKTSELKGAALDWAVATVEGYELDPYRPTRERQMVPNGQIADRDNVKLLSELRYSTDWSQGGPLIESRRVMIEPLTRLDHPEGGWYAGFKDRMGVMHGPSALIAAMRAIVAYELGNAVDVPEEGEV